ncbi:MAG: methyltransferase domain-containing protein [Planctomycetota bacterium]
MQQTTQPPANSSLTETTLAGSRAGAALVGSERVSAPAPHDVGPLVERAEALFAAGEPDLALVDLGHALAAARQGIPDYARAANDIGVIFFQRQRADLAMPFLRRAAATGSSSSLHEENLAAVLRVHDGTEGPRPANVAKTHEFDSASDWVIDAINQARALTSFAQRSVLEIGGAVPPETVSPLGVACWTALDPQATPSAWEKYRTLPGCAQNLPFPPASFDFVFSSCAFEHMAGMPQVMAEIGRILVPGGVLFSQFSPIWSCMTGHHVWVQHENKVVLSFADGVIPRWAHLLWRESEMQAFLEPIFGSEIAAEAAHQVYHHPHINRVFADEFYTLFAHCGLVTERLESNGGYYPPPPRMVERLAAAYPAFRDFASAGFRLLMRKP